MNEAAESAPVESPSPEVAQETVEAVTPESFNILIRKNKNKGI